MRQSKNQLIRQSFGNRFNEVESRGKRAVTEKTPREQRMLIADLSSSMYDTAFEGKSRYECLQEAVKPYKGRVQVLAFNSGVWEVDADKLPGPAGTTDMELALETATKLKPLSVLLISDGEPTSGDEQTFAAAKRLAGDDENGCIINTLYIGPENSERAINIMKEIAKIGRGRFRDFRIDKSSPAQLESRIDQLLALPSPGSIQL